MTKQKSKYDLVPIKDENDNQFFNISRYGFDHWLKDLNKRYNKVVFDVNIVDEVRITATEPKYNFQPNPQIYMVKDKGLAINTKKFLAEQVLHHAQPEVS